MFIIGIGLMLFRTLINVSFGVTVTVIIVGALQMLAMGMLADLINRRMNK